VNLQEIHLGSNKLRDLDSNIFSGLVNLRELNLNENSLKRIDSNLFRGILEKIFSLKQTKNN
jgi:Leucine-rich repeat (LRR) protein